jgi:hypothetical protein
MYVAGLGNPNPQIPIVVVGLVIPLMSIFFIGLGIVDLHSFPHAVTWDNNGLAMSFLFRKEQVSWEDVEWYNNIIICGIDFSGSYHIWILLKYYSIRNGSVCARKAIFFLPSVGSTMSWSAKDFLTVLDQYIPNKRSGKKA